MKPAFAAAILLALGAALGSAADGERTAVRDAALGAPAAAPDGSSARARRGRRGRRGPRGAPGPPGPSGARGDEGPPGYPHAVLPVHARISEVTVMAGSAAEGHAACTAGEIAMGGGAYFADAPGPGDQLLESGPVVVSSSNSTTPPGEDSLPNGWFASAHNGSGQPRILKVVAQCQ